MQKTIKIMSIVAVVLAAFSLFMLLVTIPFQGLIASGVFGYSGSETGAFPIFPTMPFINCFMRTACMALLIVCCGNKKGGIWMELLVLASMVFVLPAFSSAVSQTYNVFVSRAMGLKYVAANSVASTIANYCLVPAGWGQTIAYVTCGMSIVFKKMSKERTRQYEQQTLS